MPDECVEVEVNYPSCQFQIDGNCPLLSLDGSTTATNNRVDIFCPIDFLPPALDGNCRVVSATCSTGFPQTPDNTVECTVRPARGQKFNGGIIELELPPKPEFFVDGGDYQVLDVECEADGGPWCPFSVVVETQS